MQKFITVIIGVIFVIVGGFLIYRNNELERVCTKETEATVVNFKEELNTDTEGTVYTYYPILEFTYNNEKVQVKMDSGSSTPAYNVNDKITILYNPNNYKEFLVKGEKSTNIISIVFIAIGLLVIGYGIFTMLKKD